MGLGQALDPPYFTRRPYQRRVVGGADTAHTGGHAITGAEKVLRELPPLQRPHYVGDEWAVWRVVSRGLAPSVDHIDTHWTLERVLDANEYLDASDDADALAQYAARLARERPEEATAALQDPRIAGARAGSQKVDTSDLEAEEIAELRQTIDMGAGGDDSLAAMLAGLLGLPADGEEEIE